MLKRTIEDVNKFLAAASAATGFDVEDILGRDRSVPLVRARQWVMHQARQKGHSYPNIGMAMDRDHSTIVHGVRAHTKRMKGN